MFKFLKSLFGGDKQLNQEAGVQIEQVPYKVEPQEVLPVSAGELPVLVDKVNAVNAQPIAKTPKADAKPAAITAVEKPAAKKPAAKKPAAKKAAVKKKSAK
jgi:hypothetical protein